jgi:hypothetical protein
MPSAIEARRALSLGSVKSLDQSQKSEGARYDKSNRRNVLSFVPLGHLLGLFEWNQSAPRNLSYMAGPTDLFNKGTLRKRRQMKTPSKQAATEYQQARDKAFYGSLGGASPVRRIDPNTGKVVALIDPETGAALPMVNASTRGR